MCFIMLPMSNSPDMLTCSKFLQQQTTIRIEGRRDIQRKENRFSSNASDTFTVYFSTYDMVMAAVGKCFWGGEGHDDCSEPLLVTGESSEPQ